MALFFFVVGMEIKRELVVGELRDRRAVALPAMAALGGMVVPASIYAAFNAGGDGADGWGIPMATDIAFALGVVALLGSRVPPSVKVFLLTLAIVDDIGAIVVIAVFYSDGLDPRTCSVAAAIAVVGGGDAAGPGRSTPPVVVDGGVRAVARACTSRGCTPRSPVSCWGCSPRPRPIQTELEADADRRRAREPQPTCAPTTSERRRAPRSADRCRRAIA